MISKHEPNSAPAFGWLILILLGVLGLWVACGWLLYNDSQRGTFGDMFGAVNALFSGLAFAALIYTVWMQRRELALQRMELQLSRQELSGQRDEMARQNATFVLQRFENTFFELLRVHGQIVDSIDLVDEANRVTRGRDCMRVFFSRFQKKAVHLAFFDDDDDGDEVREVIQRYYSEFLLEHEEEIGHYFRHLQQTLRFVQKSGLPMRDKHLYASFVRAQLSSYELALLFYYGISVQGAETLKPLFEEFALLQDISNKVLLKPSHRDLYLPEAFKEQEWVSLG